MAAETWNWCIARDIWLSAFHIAGKFNTEADEKSRRFPNKHEWILSKQCFKLTCLRIVWKLNCLFVVRAMRILVLQTWMFSLGFSLLPKCFSKIAQDKPRGILIAPLWPAQTWFPTLLQHLHQQPWIYAPSSNMLRNPSHNQSHPEATTLRLMVCPVSGNVMETPELQMTLPRC